MVAGSARGGMVELWANVISSVCLSLLGGDGFGVMVP
jgi:hypothetical protein